MMNREKSFLAWCLGVSILTLAGCGTVGGSSVASSADPKVIVAQRAEARWKALMRGHLDTAYDYLSPATRQVLSFDVYRARVKPGMWREVKISAVTCDAELCKANVLLKYDLRDIKGLEMDLEESWLKEEGSWWYVQKK